MKSITARIGSKAVGVLIVLTLSVAVALAQPFSGVQASSLLTGQIQIVLSGDCPGELILTVVDASPSGSLEIYQGTKRGADDVPGGACSGHQTGLSNPQLLATVATDADGVFAITGTLSEGVCGRLIQPVDLTTCFTGNVARIDPGMPAAVARTGLDECWDTDGLSISCDGTGQDGELQAGVAWPDPRFTNNLDGTVTDNLTGLIWLQDPSCFLWTTWSEALEIANGLADGQCGLTDYSVSGDWRLPNIHELQSLIDWGENFPALPDGHPFSGVMSAYWTSSSYADDTSIAWIVGLWNGALDIDGFKFYTAYVWPVRGGQ